MSKIGITFSAFDLFHAGHSYFLEQCGNYCDELIVGLHVNPQLERPEKNKPVQTLYERWLQVENHFCVDRIIPYETEEELRTILKMNTINVRFLGSDYSNKDFTGKDLANVLGIETVYIPRRHGFSTSELRRRIIQAGDKEGPVI